MGEERLNRKVAVIFALETVTCKSVHGPWNLKSGAQGRGSMPYYGAISNLTFNYINSLAHQH